MKPARPFSGPTLNPATADLEKNDPRHAAARRLARLSVAEIRLYHNVGGAGCESKDLRKRLIADIAHARKTFAQRVDKAVRDRFDYLHDEVLLQLGGKVLLGSSPDRLAIHEAAHAVVMLATGRSVAAIVVREEELSHEFTVWTGYVLRGIVNHYVPDEHEVAANLAGYAAEVVFGFSDAPRFPELLCEWDAEVEADPEIEHDVRGARLFAEGAFRNAHVYDFQEADVVALLARVWRSTLAYLRRPEVRAAVEALAHLVRRRVIDNPRTIARAVERAAGRLPRLARPRLVPPSLRHGGALLAPPRARSERARGQGGEGH